MKSNLSDAVKKYPKTEQIAEKLLYVFSEMDATETEIRIACRLVLNGVKTARSGQRIAEIRDSAIKALKDVAAKEAS